MVVNHSIDPLDRVPISEMRLMVASTKGSVNGPSAREPFDQLMDQTPAAGCVTYEEANVALLHAAKEALDDIGDFLREQLHRPLDGQSGNYSSASRRWRSLRDTQ
jgi:hypothetical protein